MPYKIVKKDDYWKIYKIKDKKFANTHYKTKKTAFNAGLNWLKYAHSGDSTKLKKEIKYFKKINK